MASSTTAWRGVAAAVVAAAVGSVGAATAQAATVTVAHDTAADFRAGTTGGDTVVREPGSVEIARTLEEHFESAALPSGWSPHSWAAGGAATVDNGALKLDGARFTSALEAGAGNTLEFRADFGSEAFRHAGFATTFEDGTRWAIFSAVGDPLTLRARTSDGAGGDPEIETSVGPVPSGMQTYRIERTPTEFVYYVGTSEVPVARHTIPTSMPELSVAASDLTFDSKAPSPFSVEYFIFNTHKASGTYSHVLDAGDANVTAATLTPTVTPNGGSVTFETRTGDTPAALGVAAFTPLGPGGAVVNPKRYVEYRATLTTTDPLLTPSLDKVEATFTVADPKPPGSTGTPPGSNPSGNVPDRTKPKVLLLGRSLRVNKSGVAKLKIRCPQSEKSCKVAVKLKLRGKRIASKSKTLSSGATGTFRLKLSSSARIKLAARSSLSASAVVSAEDAAGNRRKTKHKVTLLAPGR